MELDDVSWEDELQEKFTLMSAISEEAGEDNKRWEYTSGGSGIGMMNLSEEIFIFILRKLDPTSLLRVGSTCRTLFRVCSCNSLWKKHFQVSFGVQFATATCSITAKAAFRLLFMWRTLFRNLHCNRSMQERLFAEVPFPPQRYWTQWLVVEATVPLPSVRLASADIQELWGLEAGVLEEQVKDKDEHDELMKFEWKELHDLAVEQHGGLARVYQHVLNKQHCNDHTELETLFHQYTQCRFQWLFSYWLFRQPPPFDRQLRSVFLQWRRHNKTKVATWGGTLCDVRYLASLHPITADYWRGRLAHGDETLGIQSVEGYFSMCRSLVAWILGRDWGRLKRRKVYEDTLDGVYLVLRRELQDKVVEHQRFWQVAKVQMTRVCTLEETAANYVNWRMIESLPYYKLYMVSGNSVYLNHVQGFLQRKRLVHDWIHLEENVWVQQLLPEPLNSLLEYHHKIPQDSLHGDSVSAQLSRVVWLYLNSGQQLYLEAVKGLVLQYAQAGLACYRCLNPGHSLEQAS
ncbi:uncharacterized protein si:dkeyp-114g9.1 [Hypomesus transpacificus]|uniref:uncharacterized protein si:dkeyp-114g9.1 n=1 Tax=Hypomesus transpacificus TaxID=137520 RepID=UPI001F07207E|nr:uncharacterized protein si:dkeyp-114g9.1 [Hypomesus transpacificus]